MSLTVIAIVLASALMHAGWNAVLRFRGDRIALMTMLAFAFLQHRRLSEAGRGKKAGRATAAAQPARRAGCPRRPPAPRQCTTTMPALPQVDQRTA